MKYAVAVVLAVAIVACANSSSNKQSDVRASADNIVVSWMAHCADTSAPFFSVTLKGPATIQYSGGPLVKEKGESAIGVDTLRFREISRSAQAARSLSRSRAALVDSGNSYRYCLRLLLGSTTALVPVTNEDVVRGGLQFEKELRKTSQLATLLCPMRVDYLFASGYCVPRRISFALSIGSACSPADVVEIYDNGSVHHYVSGQIGSDEYSSIAPAVVEEIAVEASAFGGEFGPTSARRSDGVSGKIASPNYKFYDIQVAAIDKITSLITAKTRITFSKSDMKPLDCARAGIDGSRGTISIRD